MRTAGAVVHLVHRFWEDPVEALENAILLGGDTDTVASPPQLPSDTVTVYKPGVATVMSRVVSPVDH